MAAEVREFAVTTPAGTPQVAPLLTSLAFPPREVTRIEVKVPPGPAGVLGFRIGSGGIPIIPTNPGAWVITDNEVIGWNLTGQITSGAWQAISYNTGSLPHTIYVRFLLDLVTPTGPPAPALIPPAALGPAAVPMLPASAGGLAALGITGG